ncbi:hypothetical protein ACH4TP_40045 [Streptomyces sp. NPDC021012]|uniref:hypothetical protein n=1 Tax=Streptomyces sp. NPDC021012 TaxID=3365107 RepID=UPI0037B092BE
MPGKVADYLRTTEPEPAERAALDQGTTVGRDQGYTPRASTAPGVHRQDLPAVPAQRKARREYENRVSALTP